MSANPVSLWLVFWSLRRLNVDFYIYIFFFFPLFFTGIRHLRGFWFSRELRGDQGEAGALAEGRPGVNGLGTVGRQHPAVLPDAACDGQTGLVPHGFSKCQLEGGGDKEIGLRLKQVKVRKVARLQIGVLGCIHTKCMNNTFNQGTLQSLLFRK